MSNPMEQASSVLNAQDAARMKATGQIQQGMTVEQWLGTMGISPQDPVETAVQKIRGQVKNATMQGKMDTMAQGAPPAGGPPAQGAPPPSQGNPARSFRDEISGY